MAVFEAKLHSGLDWNSFSHRSCGLGIAVAKISSREVCNFAPARDEVFAIYRIHIVYDQ